MTLANVIDLRAAAERRAERRVAEIAERIVLRGFDVPLDHIRAHLAGEVVPCRSAAVVDVATHELAELSRPKPARKRPGKW